MHDQDPSDSPRLAAADLTEVAGMMRGLSALAAKRGRPLPLNRHVLHERGSGGHRQSAATDRRLLQRWPETHPDRTDQGAGHAEGQGQGHAEGQGQGQAKAAVCQGPDRRPQ